MRVPHAVRWMVVAASGLFLVVCLGDYLGRVRGPRAVCDEPVYDFGVARSGMQVQHRFVLHNRGHGKFTVAALRSDCGCAAAEVSEKVVAPGASVTIDATLSLKSIRGPTRKRVVVHTDDPRRAYLVLTMQGQVQSDLTVRPEELAFAVPSSEELAPVQTVDITAEQVRFRVLRVDADSPLVSVRSETREEGRAYRLHVSVGKPAGDPTEKTHVAVKTDHPLESLIVIPVSFVGPSA